ncbi:MAG: magnesium/cobalt transporter CorA [Bacteroidia bacterium]|nr:magnesium/cobalt transporter CorA [Bacteroidia bacterium]
MKRSKDTTMRRSQKKGLPPGSLVHIGSKFPVQEAIKCHRYDAESWIQDPDLSAKTSDFSADSPRTTWLEITGLSDLKVLDPVFKKLQVNSLVLEDILNTDQNAKTDTGNHWAFFILKNIHWNGVSLTWSSEQISLVLQPDVIVSFAEKKSDLFHPVYTRLEVAGSKIRTHGPDFTFYSLLDLMVDEYLEICEELELQIEDIELSMEGKSSFDPTQTLHQIRKFQIYFRHQVMPLREGLIKLIKEPDHLISPDDLPYYQDIFDHINQIMSQLDQIRDNLASIRELYLTQLNMGMNKVIQLLTVVSTIFIPVTFIAGIYGMNFKNMPELSWKYGYFILLGFMAVIGFGSYFFFRRKRWM